MFVFIFCIYLLYSSFVFIVCICLLAQRRVKVCGSHWWASAVSNVSACMSSAMESSIWMVGIWSTVSTPKPSIKARRSPLRSPVGRSAVKKLYALSVVEKVAVKELYAPILPRIFCPSVVNLSKFTSGEDSLHWLVRAPNCLRSLLSYLS